MCFKDQPVNRVAIQDTTTTMVSAHNVQQDVLPAQLALVISNAQHANLDTSLTLLIQLAFKDVLQENISPKVLVPIVFLVAQLALITALVPFVILANSLMSIRPV